MNFNEYYNIPPELGLYQRYVTVLDNDDVPFPTNCDGLYGSVKNDVINIKKDTSYVTSMTRLFRLGFVRFIKGLKTDSAISLEEAFSNDNLQIIPQINTSKCENFSATFDAKNILTIPALDASSMIKKIYGPFTYGDCNLTNFGGFINLKTSIDQNRGNLGKCPKLTYESCINVLNGLYDFTGNGETPTSSQGVLKVHQNFLDLVGDEISIGTSKGWTISA